MPFDSRVVTARQPVLPEFATGRKGLSNLAYVLRNPVLWKEDFRWDFRWVEHALTTKKTTPRKWFWQPTVTDYIACGTAGCAIGIGRALWPEMKQYTTKDPNLVEPIARFFEMPWDDAARIFGGTHSRYPVSDIKLVTPGMVADEIDAYLARTEP